MTLLNNAGRDLVVFSFMWQLACRGGRGYRPVSTCYNDVMERGEREGRRGGRE